MYSRFLLSAVTYNFGREEDAALLCELSGGLTPSGLASLEEDAAYHELVSLLHLIAGDCGELGRPLSLPDKILEGWQRVYEREMARSAVICHGARRALAALADAGIRTIPLKGFYLTSRFYDRGGARSFRDLDLLVEEESLPALNQALLGAGFRPHPERPSFVPAPAYTVYSLTLEGSDIIMELDIHIGMHWPHEYFSRTRFRSEDLWSEASPETIEDIPAWSMSPAHLIITTLLDVAVNHRFARLIKFRDLLEVLRKTELEWEDVESWCRRWEVRSFAGPGLCLLAEMEPDLPSLPSMPNQPSLPDLPGDRESLLPSYPLMRLFMEVMPAASLPHHRARSFCLPNLLFFMLADRFSERARGLLHLPGHMIKGRQRV